MTVEGVSVVIPSFNGRRLLEANLPPLLAALEASPFPTELVVVDDGSTDGTPAFLAEKYPHVTCLARTDNVGFGRAVNAGLAQARYSLVYLLNNDIVVRKEFLEPLVAHFVDTDVFAVCSKALDPKGRTIFSRMGIAFEQGRLKLQRNDDGGTLHAAAPTLFASGGHGLYDKAKLLAFGGFDILYHPFYIEDVDRCWQAWAAGWRVVYELASVIVHDHQSTIGSIWSRGLIGAHPPPQRMAFYLEASERLGLVAAARALCPALAPRRTLCGSHQPDPELLLGSGAPGGGAGGAPTGQGHPPPQRAGDHPPGDGSSAPSRAVAGRAGYPESGRNHSAWVLI
ncbi:MAG: glycosyltransferase family 2 protein [Nitrospinae bacterium]|nr:glycosyltransferase family 2 protein [Nitrospinota bacterium]